MFQELVRYGVIGVATTVVNMVVYLVCTDLLAIHYLVANVLAWVVAVLFAFFANKTIVFRSPYISFSATVKELTAFALLRVTTGVVEMALLLVGVEWLDMNDKIVKLVATVLVIILNYFFSKWIVFAKKKAKE